MKTFRKVLSRSFLCLFFSIVSHGRQLDGKAGVGLTIHDLENTPCVSYRQHLSNYQSFVLLVGANTASDKRVFVGGGKFLQNVHLEENVNLHLGVGGYLLNGLSPAGSTSTGIEFSGLLGGEFFLSGLPNLGFTFETGIAMRTLNNVHFVTLGNGFLGLAIHYYF